MNSRIVTPDKVIASFYYRLKKQIRSNNSNKVSLKWKFLCQLLWSLYTNIPSITNLPNVLTNCPCMAQCIQLFNMNQYGVEMTKDVHSQHPQTIPTFFSRRPIWCSANKRMPRRDFNVLSKNAWIVPYYKKHDKKFFVSMCRLSKVLKFYIIEQNVILLALDVYTAWNLVLRKSQHDCGRLVKSSPFCCTFFLIASLLSGKKYNMECHVFGFSSLIGFLSRPEGVGGKN